MDENRLSGLITPAELEQAIQSGLIDTVMIAFCDMQGRLMGKRLTGEFYLRNVQSKGTHFCTYLLGTDMEMNTPSGYEQMNWESGYGDWLASPDWSTLRVIPWLEKTAMVLCDVADEKAGSPIGIAPRNILKKQMLRAEQKGFRLMMASELEFYLFKESYENIHDKGYQHMQTSGHYNEDYNLLQGTRNEPLYRKIRNHMNAAGIPIESTKGEAAVGQHEINMLYADALTSADRHVMLKHGVKEICMQHEHAVTFMAKPHNGWTGSSGHIHISLWDLQGEQNLFYDAAEQPYGMSQTMKYFLGGILACTRDFSLFFAPNVNSYKRFAPDSWAPVHIVWSHDNRTSGLRIVGDQQSLRIENRIPGADMNPYLAYSAMIAAGLYGIENGIEPTAEWKGNAYTMKGLPRVPASLYEAMELWKESPIVRSALGDQVTDHYYNMAKVEQQALNTFVTDWERARYFEQI
ncbi:glutamine synthetase family protein [Paenibacillus roseipurpureus]|uniref:Glutamine synthetase family protein n=1 Tax=Paenibacillus roseopurpureus TaxID=2918901 RepID=A0AA96RMQ0_9BACL|nr:glutamine synthetase family protein [Paenibacillus sp. MBLB1832]WNR46925.1 glutamine synthetase family protein [Paenibacillus sp. MBLB1832]